jgi:hypothetical protein
VLLLLQNTFFETATALSHRIANAYGLQWPIVLLCIAFLVAASSL